MEHEIRRMDQRLSDLEDTQLEAMERLETAETAEQAMKDEAAAIASDVEATRASFTRDMAGVDEELRGVLAEREALAARVPAELMDEYERSRSRNGALAVVEVRDGQVLGAATELSPAELEDVRRTPEDQLCWAGRPVRSSCGPPRPDRLHPGRDPVAGPVAPRARARAWVRLTLSGCSSRAPLQSTTRVSTVTDPPSRVGVVGPTSTSTTC